MKELQIFNSEEFGQVRTVVIDNEPYFVGKDVAAALGYGEGKALNNAVAAHIDDEDKGVTEMMTPGGKQRIVIINESGLYALVFGSKLETAKKFRRWVTADVLPALRKTGAYQMEKLSPELSPQLQLLINLELKQKEHDAKLNRLDSKIDSIKEVVALNPNDWRKDTGKIINKIAQNLGGYEHIKVIREESYRLLEQRMGVALNIRLTNKKKTMSLNGVCKSKIDKLNQLDVIADDKKLIEGYISIIKDMAIKYGIADGEVA